MFNGLKFLQLIVISVAFMGSVSAAEPINTLERSGLWGYEDSGIAVRGYDTVAYYTLGKPAEGNDAFATDWMGAKWRFSSQQHLDLFVANPEKYAPQFGGYCAYGVAVGNLVKIEADLWDIVDDKLYLNFNEDLQEKWRKDIPGFIVKANDKFDRLLAEE
jgi:YHS domain-containing protein